MAGENTFSYTGIGLPALVSQTDMKHHLRITDSAHDADVDAANAAAQDAVLAYLGGASIDPTWTATTAPKTVIHAIKILCGHFYEHRGDDDADPVKVWEGLAHLVGRHRDPSLA